MEGIWASKSHSLLRSVLNITDVIDVVSWYWIIRGIITKLVVLIGRSHKSVKGYGRTKGDHHDY